MDALNTHNAKWKEGDRPLLVFPEGTTSNGKGLLEFRKGAFVAGKPIRPVLIKYTGSWDPSNTNFIAEERRSTATSSQSRTAYVPYSEQDWAIQFAGHLTHTCTVLVCQEYSPSKEEVKQPDIFAKN